MRQLYNVFNPIKITRETIRIALELKQKGNYKNAFLKDNDAPIPTDKNQFLGYLCAKYLGLSREDGEPLLRTAYKQQYKIEDEHKICQNCKKPFRFTRQSKIFCSHRCQVRFYRKGTKRPTGVTVSPISSDKKNSNYAVSGSLTSF